MKLFENILLLSLVLSFSSCLIDNDMSYPRVSADIVTFNVEGQVSSSVDPKTHTVSIVLDECADIRKLRLAEFAVAEGVVAVTSISEGDIIDLSTSMTVVLKIYAETEWTISAVQPIDRYVKCANEARPAQIDLVNRSVTVFVSQNQPLESVLIYDMKLEPEGSKIISTYGKELVDWELVDKNVDCSFPMTLYCVLQRIFLVEYKGQKIIWTFNVVQEAVGQEVTSVIPWCYHADIKATYDGEGIPAIQYRKVSEADWTSFSDVLVEGNNITCSLYGLSEGTDYAVRVTNGEDVSGEAAFRTGTPDQLENMSFDSWYQDGKVWYPNANSSVKVWDTANKGASITGSSPTMPTDNVCDAGVGTGKQAARLESRSAFGLLAAGNIYTGMFGKVSGLGAELQWGTPFTGRPKALHGYYAYEPRPIDKVKEPYQNMAGEMDKCQILVMLTDWDAPFQVNTNAGAFVDQENDPHIVAYAKYESSENTGGRYKEFTLELDWRRLDAVPKYAVVVACSSYLGNYFTGAIGSMMYVDEFEFLYD